MENLRNLIVERIQSLAAFHGGSRAGEVSMRWNGTKELLYEIVNGAFQPDEREKTKKKKYSQIDLTTFDYSQLDDGSLVTMYETVCRRHNVCM